MFSLFVIFAMTEVKFEKQRHVAASELLYLMNPCPILRIVCVSIALSPPGVLPIKINQPNLPYRPVLYSNKVIRFESWHGSKI